MYSSVRLHVARRVRSEREKTGNTDSAGDAFVADASSADSGIETAGTGAGYRRDFATQDTVVDVIARNTPLRDVLHVIADATGLNLIMEREVNPDFPVTMTLRNVTAKDALDTIFASVDYFYAIENNKMFIRATDSRVYEIGFPAIVQNYSSMSAAIF